MGVLGMTGNRFCVAVLVTLLFAGCVDSPVDPDDGSGTDAELPMLADFTECDFTYPDNETPIPCEDQFQRGEVVGTEQPMTVPSGWLCTHRGGSSQDTGAEYWMHWNPAEDKYGVYYEVRDPIAYNVSGYLYNTVTDYSVVWYGGGETGFVEVPDPGRDELRLRLYTHGYESDTPSLQDGSIRAIWGMHNDVPYPLQELTTDEGTYYFHNVSGGLLTEDYYRYDVEPFSMEGEDFNITVGYQRLFDRGTFMMQEPRPGCATI